MLKLSFFIGALALVKPVFSQAVSVSSSGSVSANAVPTGSSVDSNGNVEHFITVGGLAGLVYTPNNIQVAAGEFVTFIFQQKNHTATQTSFPSPCSPLKVSTSGAVTGFDSGFTPVSPNATHFPTFTVKVLNASVPIWFSCQQANHCETGMVGALNAPAQGNTFAKFLATALAAGPGGTATPPPPTDISTYYTQATGAVSWATANSYPAGWDSAQGGVPSDLAAGNTAAQTPITAVLTGSSGGSLPSPTPNSPSSSITSISGGKQPNAAISLKPVSGILMALIGALIHLA